MAKICYNMLMETLSQHWSVILAIVGVIASYATLRAQNSEQERRICELETRVEHMNPLLMEIRERLASIEATLKIMNK